MILIDAFIDDMELTHGIQSSEMSIADAWKSRSPKAASELNIEEFFEDVSTQSIVT